MVVGWVAVLGGYKDTPAEEMDFQDQGITKAHAETVAQNTPKTPKNDFVCPLCSKELVDKREWSNGEWTRQISSKGNKLPAFQCIDNDDFNNPTCKGVVWDYDSIESKKALQHDLVEDENLEEAEKMALDAEDIPF